MQIRVALAPASAWKAHCIGNSVLEMSIQRSWSRRGACYLWYTDQQRIMHDADFSEIHAWRQVRWIAGVVVSETLDPGIKSPQWHTLLGGHVEAKHENAELKEAILNLLQVTFQGCCFCKEDGCRKHFDIGVSNESKCQSCHDRRRFSKAQVLPLTRMDTSLSLVPRGFQEVGAQFEELEEGMEVTKMYCSASLKWKSMEREPFSSWKSGRQRSRIVWAS